MRFIGISLVWPLFKMPRFVNEHRREPDAALREMRMLVAATSDWQVGAIEPREYEGAVDCLLVEGNDSASA
jgi:hypothetical protein